LKDSVRTKDLEAEIQSLNKDISTKQQERNNPVESIDPMEKEYSVLEGKVKTAKTGLETFETQITNLHSKEGFQKVLGYLVEVQEFVNDTYQNIENQVPSEIVGTTARFVIDKENFRLRRDNSKKLELYLKADEFTQESVENSKTELVKIKDQIKVDMEQAERESQITQFMRPGKRLLKLTMGIGDSLQFLVNKTYKTADGIIVPTIGFNQLKENLFVA